MITAEELAKSFHESYCRLAPAIMPDLVVLPWEQLPDQARQLLIAVCADVLSKTQFLARVEPETIGEMIKRDFKAAFLKGYQDGKARTEQKNKK